MLAIHNRRRLTKRWNAGFLGPLANRVESCLDLAPHFRGQRTRLRQRHLLDTAKTNVAPLATFLDSAYPRLAAARRHHQIEAIPVGIASWRTIRLDESSAKLTHFIPHLLPHEARVTMGFDGT